jgi:hypothetical protein
VSLVFGLFRRHSNEKQLVNDNVFVYYSAYKIKSFHRQVPTSPTTSQEGDDHHTKPPSSPFLTNSKKRMADTPQTQSGQGQGQQLVNVYEYVSRMLCQVTHLKLGQLS